MILDKRKIGLIILGIFAVVTLLLLNQLRLNNSLRITNSDPQKILPTSQRNIRLTFNRSLNKQAISAKNIAVSGDKKFSFKVDGSKLTIVLAEYQNEKAEVVINLKDVTAVDGKKMSHTLKFEAAYVPFDKLSDAEQKLQTQNSNSFETDFPLMSDLPFIGSDFTIDYEYPSDQNARMPIIVSTTAINTDDPLAEPDSPANLEIIRTSRTHAMEWLKQNGFDTKKYRLYFAENLLLSEFGGEYDESILKNQQ